MRRIAILSVLAASLLGGCGPGSAGPTAPSAPAAAADIRGVWVQVNGDARTWTLEQYGIQAGGTASFSQANNPGVGAVAGRGGVVGAIARGAYMFAETYEGLDIPSRPSPNSCYIDTSGQLGISGTTMRGTVIETLGCGGVRVSQASRDLVMQRQ